MAEQATLFDAPATAGRSRRSDPATSRAAARSMSGQVLRDQQALVLEAVAAHGERGANAHEVQDWLRNRGRSAPERNGIGTRFAELRDQGWVRLLEGVSHRTPGQVHEVTDAGRQRLAEYLKVEGQR